MYPQSQLAPSLQVDLKNAAEDCPGQPVGGITGGKETLKHLILKCQDLDLNPSTTPLLTYLHIQLKKNVLVVTL